MSEPETTPPTEAAGPTVVLVHGSFADASGWAGVIPILQAAGLNVMAPANPLRGLSADTAYIASVVSQIDGPVLLVAHSYGGAVITNAASQVDNVVGLVYVSAFIPDEGETILAPLRSRPPTASSAQRCGPPSTQPAAPNPAPSSTSIRRRSTRCSVPTSRLNRRL